MAAPCALKPLNDFLVILPDPVKPYHEYKQYTNIVVPDRFDHGPEDRPVWGVVQSRGGGCRNEEIRNGSHVLIGKWDGARVLHQGITYLIVREDMVIATDA